MLILMNQKPSPGYLAGMVIVVLASIALVAFLFGSGVVSIFKASLITLGVGSLVYYYSLPILAKRQSYIGDDPGNQLVQVNLIPYMIFVVICLVLAGYGWYANV